MALSPINFARISQNLRTDLLSDSIRRSGRDLFLAQTRLATGRSFVAASEDPVAAKQSLDLTEALARHHRLSANVQYGDNMLAAADTAMSEVSSLLTEAQTIASQDVSNLTSAAERTADAELIAAIRRQLISVGNRQFNGKYLFGGRETVAAPFWDGPGGVTYQGDTGDLFTRIAEGPSQPVNVPGNVLFGALSARIGGDVDLSPALSAQTRLADVRGAGGAGVRSGVVVFNESGGGESFAVDISGTETIGDVVARINDAAAEAGSGLRAEVGTRGIDILPTGAVTITDRGAGLASADLGLRTVQPTSTPITGANLGARVTMLTPVSDLAGGAGVSLEGGLTLHHAGEAILVDLSAAQTVQDLIRALNAGGDFATARINAAGTGIELHHRLSGSTLAVAEGSGTSAAELGLRTLQDHTPVGGLNFGRGIGLDPRGPDLQIAARSGETVDVDLDSAATISAVITAMNDAAEAAGVAVRASLNDEGSGIRVEDTTGGTGLLTVVSLGESTAAIDLGFTQPAEADATELIGENRSAVRPEGALGALIDLEAALRADDTQGITVAAERLDRALQDLIRVHGTVGARSQAMRADLAHMTDAAQTTEIVLSQVRDLDYAEAATQLQALQTQYQAGLQSGAALLRLSLMDFLR